MSGISLHPESEPLYGNFWSWCGPQVFCKNRGKRQ